jgi:hypothetical protein
MEAGENIREPDRRELSPATGMLLSPDATVSLSTLGRKAYLLKRSSEQ